MNIIENTQLMYFLARKLIPLTQIVGKKNHTRFSFVLKNEVLNGIEHEARQTFSFSKEMSTFLL